MYKYVDYLNQYGRIMQFNKNKFEPIHRWYPFVEGYSKEFIKSIIEEINKTNIVCLEPFSGSGTTALELQNMGIRCFSFEVNPLMFLVSRVKLNTAYSVESIQYWHNYIISKRNRYRVGMLSSDFYTLYEGQNKDKWNYNTEVGIAVERLKRAILSIESELYQDLFLVSLAAILLDVSNLYRNGKCLSYKDAWRDINITRDDVYHKFDEKVKNEIIPDVVALEQTKQADKAGINNYELIFNNDCRIAIDDKIGNSSIDLVITSPPYLNSRDYTDTYMLELKTLGFFKDFDDIRKLRKKTIRSHVQVKWADTESVDNPILQETLEQMRLSAEKSGTWNDSILDMVRLYFVDMQTLFRLLYKKIKVGGRVYFNVSNSAYFGIKIDTLEICASIAENEGFRVLEIRKARYLKSSPQQRSQIDKLLEGVLVLER